MEPLPELERIARTESLFREVNERIAESARRLDADDAEFVCECGDSTCTDRVSATLDEYERIRADGATFLLVPGHEDSRVEAVVEREDEHAVVEKTHPQVAPLVAALDPRAA
jgi:hypothetical protein